MDFVLSKIMEKGIKTFYGLNSYSEILLVGHSELMLAIDKVTMENELDCGVAKYTREGVNVADRLVMLKHYFDLPCSDSVKIVLYGVDQFIFTGEGLSANSYKLFYPFMDNQIINRYIRENASSMYDYWSHENIRTSRFNDALINAVYRGFMHDWGNFKDGFVDIDRLKEDLAAGSERHIMFEEDNIKIFEETLDFLHRKGVRVFLVNPPLVDLINEFEPEKYAEIMSMFKNYSSRYDNVVFLDYNPEFSSDYSLFYDRIHLNKQGQREVTKAIVGDLKAYLKN